MIELEISQKLAPYLLQLKKEFTTYQLKNIIPLKSTYSIRLYEILKKYEKIGEKKYSVAELKRILQIENEYPLYGNFNDRILRVAEKEIKQKCDIYFEMVEIKIGRKVDSIRFIIRKNKNVEDAPKSITLSEEQKKLFDRMIHFFSISEFKLETVFKKYPFEKIQQAFIDVLDRLKVQEIKSPKAYFLTLLADVDYGMEEKVKKQKKAQLQLDMTESEKSEQEKANHENEVKSKVTAWIADNPTEYENLVEEEKMRLG